VVAVLSADSFGESMRIQLKKAPAGDADKGEGGPVSGNEWEEDTYILHAVQ